MPEWWLILLIGTVVFCTFTVEGIAGFGSTVMALPFVILLIGLKQAVPLLSSLNLLLALFLICRSRRNIVWREYLFIVLNVGAGVPVGLFMMDRLPQKILIGLLTFFTLAVGAGGIRKTLKDRPVAADRGHKKNLLSCLILFCGGIFQGAFSSGGPLVVTYAAKAIPEKNTFRATLPLLWFTTNFIMNLKWIWAGNVWSRPLFLHFLWALPFIGAGMLLGDHLHRKVDQKKFTLLVYGLLIVVAVILGISVFRR